MTQLKLFDAIAITGFVILTTMVWLNISAFLELLRGL